MRKKNNIKSERMISQIRMWKQIITDIRWVHNTVNVAYSYCVDEMHAECKKSNLFLPYKLFYARKLPDLNLDWTAKLGHNSWSVGFTFSALGFIVLLMLSFKLGVSPFCLGFIFGFYLVCFGLLFYLLLRFCIFSYL